MTQEALDLQRKRRLPIPLRLVIALATLIGIGTGLLLLPWMTTQRISVMEALFTATSAVTVTGLAVLTTSTAFTRLGQWVILLLMQLGGLGFVVVTVLTLRLLGRRISLLDRLAVSSSLGLASPKAILQVLGRTVAFMLAVEGVGALILWVHWRMSGIVPAGDAAFYALFHAVAAFCNAGFDLFGGLPQYPAGLPADPISLLTLGWLVILGGLGIPVYMELLHRWEVRNTGGRRRRLSLQTRLALWSALILILIGWAGLLDQRVPVRGGVVGPAVRGTGAAGLVSVGGCAHGWLCQPQRFRQSPRGQPPVAYVSDVHRQRAGLHGRRDHDRHHSPCWWSPCGVSPAAMIQCMLASVPSRWRWSGAPSPSWSSAWASSSLRRGCSCSARSWTFSSALFEVVSAFSTTGLSLGVTGQLDTFGRLLIIAIMFWGRLGAITIMLALLKGGTRESLVKYPEETVLVG